MAKASNVAAKTAKRLLILEERAERIEMMLEVMLTKKQRADLDALLADMEADEDVPEPAAPAIVKEVATIHGDMEVLLEARDGEPEKA
jgi:hypothetical protein